MELMFWLFWFAFGWLIIGEWIGSEVAGRAISRSVKRMLDTGNITESDAVFLIEGMKR